jgi:hypothetical protein
MAQQRIAVMRITQHCNVNATLPRTFEHNLKQLHPSKAAYGVHRTIQCASKYALPLCNGHASAPADNQSIRLLFILTEQHNFSFLSDHVVHPTLPAQSAPQSHINQPPRLAATPDQHTSSVLQKVWLPSHGNQDIITQSSFLPLPGPKSDCNHTKSLHPCSHTTKRSTCQACICRLGYHPIAA